MDMEVIPPRPNRTKTVVIHLTPQEWERTMKAADSDGLRTGPWVRMHLFKILKAKDAKKARKEAKQNGS